MLNLVEKFTPEAVEATDEDGVVAIEYVARRRRLVAAVVVARRRPAFGGLADRLELIDTVVG